MDFTPTYFSPKDSNIDLPKTVEAKNIVVTSVRNPYPHGYSEPFVRIALDGKHFDVARSKEGNLYDVFAKAFANLYS